jgi:hypothetical protein
MTEAITSLFIGTPAYSGVSCAHALMLMKLWRFLRERGVTPRHAFVEGCSNLPAARDQILWQFMQSDAEAAFLVDADVAVDPEVVGRLIDSGRDFVGVVGATRLPDAATGVRRLLISVDLNAPVVDGLVEVSSLGISATLLRRTCVAQMLKAHPELTHVRPGPTVLGGLFVPVVEGGILFAEDAAFSRRWARIGGKQHLLVDADVTHGETVCNVAQVLEASRALSAAPPPEQLEARR